jgi:hypothetical protein
MVGDGHDLTVLLTWARNLFWVDQIDPSDPGSFVDWPYPAEARLNIAVLMQELCQAFDVSEQAHRKEHSLTGSKTQVKVCFLCFRSGVY